MKKIILFISAITIINFISCSKGGSPVNNNNNNNNNNSNCSGVPKSFSADVNPVIQSTCATNASCHGSGSVNGPGELLTYSEVFNARVSINSAVASGIMPKTGSLTAGQKNSILCWISSGAPNN